MYADKKTSAFRCQEHAGYLSTVVTKEYGIRTEAAHGKWNINKDDGKLKENHKALVNLMIDSIKDLIRRNPIWIFPRHKDG